MAKKSSKKKTTKTRKKRKSESELLEEELDLAMDEFNDDVVYDNVLIPSWAKETEGANPQNKVNNALGVSPRPLIEPSEISPKENMVEDRTSIERVNSDETFVPEPNTLNEPLADLPSGKNDSNLELAEMTLTSENLQSPSSEIEVNALEVVVTPESVELSESDDLKIERFSSGLAGTDDTAMVSPVRSSRNAENFYDRPAVTRPESSKRLSTGTSRSAVDVAFLSGQNRAFIELAFQDCKRNGSLVSSRFTRSFVTETLGYPSSDAVGTVVQRLCERGFLRRSESKVGRGGWFRVEIPKDVFDQLTSLESLQSNANPNVQLRHIEKTIKESFVEAPGDRKSDLPLEWKNLDLSGLDEVGIKATHIRQIFESGKSDLETVSGSLEALRHDVINKKVPKNVENVFLVFMKCLRSKGEPYTSFDPSFESSIERAERLQAEVLLERKRERERAREERQKALDDARFEDWRSSLSEEEVEKLIPNEMRPYLKKPYVGEGLSKTLVGLLRNHFFGSGYGSLEEVERTVASGSEGEPRSGEAIGALINTRLRELR